MNEEKILKRIRGLMASLNISHFPTIKNIREFDKELERELYKLGGNTKFAQKYNIPLRRPKIRWNDKKILEELWNVVNTLELNHYPTHENMRKVTGDETLTNASNKRKSYKEWASLMNLPIKEGDTFFGHDGEEVLKNHLEDLGYKCERLSTNCVYDFLINEEVRVDCKISKLYHGSNGSFYSYNLERPDPDCDLFIFITLDDEENKRFMVVPQSVLRGQKQVSMGMINSKWYEYENRFDFIDKYVDFYKSLV